jgi:hypothetical protein
VKKQSIVYSRPCNSFGKVRKEQHLTLPATKGFYYHFLHMDSGRRAWNCELSTIDSTILIAGALTAATYFDHETEQEQKIRTLANDLYLRMDWLWALNRDGKGVNGLETGMWFSAVVLGGI